MDGQLEQWMPRSCNFIPPIGLMRYRFTVRGWLSRFRFGGNFVCQVGFIIVAGELGVCASLCR